MTQGRNGGRKGDEALDNVQNIISGLEFLTENSLRVQGDKSRREITITISTVIMLYNQRG